MSTDPHAGSERETLLARLWEVASDDDCNYTHDELCEAFEAVERALLAAPTPSEERAELCSVMQRADDDCLMACVASVFGVPLESLPRLDARHHDGSWYEVLRDTYHRLGYELLYTENEPALAPEGYQIAGGPSPRGCKGGHAVVMLNGRLAHDPHPSGAGIPTVERWYLRIPLARRALAPASPSEQDEGEPVSQEFCFLAGWEACKTRRYGNDPEQAFERFFNPEAASPSVEPPQEEDEGPGLAEAISFAMRAHRDQWYRGYNGRADEPYIAHPLRVMDAVSTRAKVVAVLHDCLEDAGVLPDWLNEGERAMLDLLTRDKKRETYTEYIARIAGACGTLANIAREVKIADLRDNLAHDPPPHLRERYEAALAILVPAPLVQPEPQPDEERP